MKKACRITILIILIHFIVSVGSVYLCTADFVRDTINRNSAPHAFETMTMDIETGAVSTIPAPFINPPATPMDAIPTCKLFRSSAFPVSPLILPWQKYSTGAYGRGGLIVVQFLNSALIGIVVFVLQLLITRIQK